MRSRSSGRWTLGGHRSRHPRCRTTTGFPCLAEGDRAGRWTLGGHPDRRPLP
jgi:hypothetical protein